MGPRNGAEARDSLSDHTADDPALDLIDVPAAVVCANCGDAACPGCGGLHEITQSSGVVAIVPWERPGLSLTRRLWSTAELATTASSAFFAALPDGDLAAAVRFALTAEILAVLGLAAALVPLAVALAPNLVHSAWADPAMRRGIVRALACCIPGLAFFMVFLHVLHGVGLDRGARRLGARPRRGRGLRFGLYSCGWDLVTLPLGWLVVLLSSGPRAAWRTIPLGMSVPAKAARAYLRGVYRLDEAQARQAARHAVTLPAAAVVLGSIAGLTVAVLFAVLV